MTLAHLTRFGTAQELEWIGGGVQRIVLDSDATCGRLAAIRQVMPGGVAASVHVHENQDETIFLISGTGTFWAGDQRWDLRSGDTVFLPRLLPHAYILTSPEAMLLTICNPAGWSTPYRVSTDGARSGRA